MNIVQALESVRFVVGKDGKPTDAILSIDVWEKLVTWLEDIEDSRVVKSGLARLKEANYDTRKAGLIPWSDVEIELDKLEEKANV